MIGAVPGAFGYCRLELAILWKGAVKYSYVFSVYYSGYTILPVSTGYRTAVLNMNIADIR